MPSDDQSGSTLPRRQLGRDLREARAGTGFTQEQVGQALEMRKTTIGRIEKGLNDKVRQRDIEAFGTLYELPPEQVAELRALAEQMATKSRWQKSRRIRILPPGFRSYLELESATERLASDLPLPEPRL